MIFTNKILAVYHVVLIFLSVHKQLSQQDAIIVQVIQGRRPQPAVRTPPAKNTTTTATGHYFTSLAFCQCAQNCSHELYKLMDAYTLRFVVTCYLVVTALIEYFTQELIFWFQVCHILLLLGRRCSHCFTITYFYILQVVELVLLQEEQ